MIPGLIIPMSMCAQFWRSTLAIVVRAEGGRVTCAEVKK